MMERCTEGHLLTRRQSRRHGSRTGISFAVRTNRPSCFAAVPCRRVAQQESQLSLPTINLTGSARDRERGARCKTDSEDRLVATRRLAFESDLGEQPGKDSTNARGRDVGIEQAIKDRGRIDLHLSRDRRLINLALTCDEFGNELGLLTDLLPDAGVALSQQLIVVFSRFENVEQPSLNTFELAQLHPGTIEFSLIPPGETASQRVPERRDESFREEVAGGLDKKGLDPDRRDGLRQSLLLTIRTLRYRAVCAVERAAA